MVHLVQDQCLYQEVGVDIVPLQFIKYYIKIMQWQIASSRPLQLSQLAQRKKLILFTLKKYKEKELD